MFRKWKKGIAAIVLAATVLTGLVEPVAAQPVAKTMGLLQKEEVARILKDLGAKMVDNAEKDIINAYNEYLEQFPSGKVSDLQVISRTMDSVTLYWSNKDVKNAQFFSVDYWPICNPKDKKTVYVSHKDQNSPSGVIDYPVSVFQLGGLDQQSYNIMITAGNYGDKEKYTDGRKYQSDAAGGIMNDYATISSSPAPVAPTELAFRNLNKGYCSVTVSGINEKDQTYHVEAELIDCENGRKIGTFTAQNYQRAMGISLESDKIQENHFYGVRARAYLEEHEDARIYSDWTEYTYAGSKLSSTTVSQKNKKVTLKWKKVNAASDYVVYISKDKNSGYKKVAATKKLSQKITQYKKKALKKGTQYYLKVEARYIKDGDVYIVSSTPRRVTIY